MRYYTVGELSKIVNMNIETIRYYEKINLIPKPEKFENGYKKYSEMYVYKLKLIMKAKSYGFTLHEIANFLCEVSNNGIEGMGFNEIIENKVKEVDEECKKLIHKKEMLIEFQSEIEELTCPVLNKIINEKNV
ncbi:MerR family transcriptional regulator [Clostridium hydrogenum]|uniref:MerR family transcriptional regulator n=1 Tax=Clostridium hydrogenum TaxID=2855764 RepID=UPI001F3BF927|nr:MerR family transcriptional regulator [Clostridium hydrogenum]